MKRLLCVLVALWPVTVQAQTTCPVAPTSSSVQSGTVLHVTWCARTADGIAGAVVYGLPSGPLAVLGTRVIGGPYNDGSTQYQGTIPAQPVGMYTLTLTTTGYNTPGDPTSGATEGPPSLPFALTVVSPPASAPLAAPTNVLFSK